MGGTENTGRADASSPLTPSSSLIQRPHLSRSHESLPCAVSHLLPAFPASSSPLFLSGPLFSEETSVSSSVRMMAHFFSHHLDSNPGLLHLLNQQEDSLPLALAGRCS